MEKKKTVFDFLSHVFTIYGITVVMLVFINMLTGNDSGKAPTMFSLGTKGLSSALLLQILLVSFLIIALQYLFFSERIFKKKSLSFRTIGMLASILILMSIMIIAFAWFPTGMILPWVMFIAFFLGSFGASIFVMFIKERTENKVMADGLDRYKKKLKRGKNGE